MFRYAAEPFFFNLYKKKGADIVYANVLKYFTIFMMVVFLVVSLGIDIFKYFIDERYYEGLRIVPVVLLANALVGMLFNVNMWYKLTGRTMYGVYITGAGALITVVLNVIFIPLYSFQACAWIHLGSNLVMLLITYFIGQRIYRINYDIKNILIYICTAVGFYILGSVLQSEKVLFNLGIAVIFVLLYILFCSRRENLSGIFIRGNEN
jgi:O-antigen/teichoic acid export membrane protein